MTTRDAEKRPAKYTRSPPGKKKQLITIRLDPDVLEAFKRMGEGYQTKMQEALRKAVMG